MKIKPNVITLNQVWRIGEMIHKPSFKALYFTTYLTAGRISEVLGLKAKQLVIKEEYKDNTLQKFLVFKDMWNEKNTIIKYKSPVGIYKGLEARMIDYILSYSSLLDDEELLFKKFDNRYKINNEFKKIQINTSGVTPDKKLVTNYSFKLYPHYLRHTRLTHLVDNYSFNNTQLMFFAGWTDSKLANTYVRRNPDTFIHQMLR